MCTLPHDSLCVLRFGSIAYNLCPVKSECHTSFGGLGFHGCEVFGLSGWGSWGLEASVDN